MSKKKTVKPTSGNVVSFEEAPKQIDKREANYANLFKEAKRNLDNANSTTGEERNDAINALIKTCGSILQNS